MQDDIIPVMIECGGHDGITKSLTLKASMYLNMNTLLIEGSPSNFKILKQTRNCDFSVNAALCDGTFIEMIENTANSGETRVASTNDRKRNAIKTKCTSIDEEFDKLTALLPESQRNMRDRPHKVFMEGKHASETDQVKITDWAKHNNLVDKACTGQADLCYNAHPSIPEKPDHLKSLFHGSRPKIPTKLLLAPRHTCLWGVENMTKLFRQSRNSSRYKQQH
eukprot:scaffold54848_cov46-Attheya_sp.AAC.5